VPRCPVLKVLQTLGAAMSLALESPVEGLALPKSAENGKLSLNEVVILSMSVKIWHFS
jgi:hypothetical protein